MNAPGRHDDVIVVGAGLAGLGAARELRRAGLTVRVLEARQEVGGRTRSRAVAGQVADFGAEWIGRGHRRTRALVKEFDLSVEPARNTGFPVLWRLPDGERIGRLPPRGTRLALARVFAAAARRARAVDRVAPWISPRARELDALSVADWLGQLGIGGGAQYILECLIGSLSSSDLDGMSLLHLLWWTRHAGGPLRSLHTTFQWRVAEGAQEIARRAAASLGPIIELDSPVRRIAQHPDHVEVASRDGRASAARYVVLAVPTPALAKLELDPPLPDPLRALSGLRIGAGTKVIAALPAGHTCRYNTVLGGRSLWGAWRRGQLVTGFAPPPASDLSDDELRRDLAAAFDARPANLRSCTVFRWADERYIAGCDAAFAPGEVCALGPNLTRPHGRIEFAGSERSSWPNNLEGALESGERAARNILRALA